MRHYLLTFLRVSILIVLSSNYTGLLHLFPGNQPHLFLVNQVSALGFLSIVLFMIPLVSWKRKIISSLNKKQPLLIVDPIVKTVDQASLRCDAFFFLLFL